MVQTVRNVNYKNIWTDVAKFFYKTYYSGWNYNEPGTWNHKDTVIISKCLVHIMRTKRQENLTLAGNIESMRRTSPNWLNGFPRINGKLRTKRKGNNDNKLWTLCISKDFDWLTIKRILISRWMNWQGFQL